MKSLTAIRDIARLYDIRDILGLSSRKKKIVCPLPMHPHKNNTPSFGIFVTNQGSVQKWKCFGACGLHGDCIDLVGYLRIPGYNPKSGDDVKQAVAILTGGTRINPPRQETTKQATLNNGLYKRYLPAGDEVRNYATSRGLKQETLDRFQIGQKKTPSTFWMTMPAIHGDRLMGIKMRNVNSQDKRDRFSQVPGSVDGLFGFNMVRDTKEPVAVVKAEIAVMILSQFEILACAPTGGESSYYAHDQFLLPLAFSKRRIVIGDNDNDPKIRAEMVAAAKRRSEIFKADMFLPPDPYTGIDDFVLAEPETAIPLIRSWLS